MNGLLRLVTILVLLLAAWKTTLRLTAIEVDRAGMTREDLDAALEWDPDNPDLRSKRGRLLQSDVDSPDLSQAEADLRRAVELNPHDWNLWFALAQHLELAGKPGEAAEAFRKVIEISPNSGFYRWQFGNFQLRQGDVRGGLESLGTAIALRSEYLGAAASLFLRMRLDRQSVEELWPRTPAASSALLKFWMARLPETTILWGAKLGDDLLDRLFQSPDPPTMQEVSFYLNYLLREKRFADARRRWIEVWRLNGVEEEEYASGANRVWNGDFEVPLTGGALDWSNQAVEGVRADVERDRENDFSQGWKIEFGGTRNLDYRGIRQRLIVEGDRSYRLVYRARVDRISTDQGVYLEVFDGRGQVLAAGERLVGSEPWREYTVEFKVPSDIEEIWLSVRRDRSRRIDSLIAGTCWLDDVAVKPLAAGG